MVDEVELGPPSPERREESNEAYFEKLNVGISDLVNAAKPLKLNLLNEAYTIFCTAAQSLKNPEEKNLLKHRIPLLFFDYWSMRVELEDQARTKALEVETRIMAQAEADQPEYRRQLDELVDNFCNALLELEKTIHALQEKIGLTVTVPTDTMRMRDEHFELVQGEVGSVKRVLRPALYDESGEIFCRARVWGYDQGDEGRPYSLIPDRGPVF